MPEVERQEREREGEGERERERGFSRMKLLFCSICPRSSL